MSGAFMLMLQAFLGWTYILHMQHDVIRHEERRPGGVWQGNKMVLVGVLAGDDANPIRLMDVWIGEL